MNNLMVGSYVKYKNSVRLVIDNMTHVESVRLVSPLLTGSNVNVVVSTKNIELTNLRPAVSVGFKNGQYLVTATDRIYSLKTFKLMKWSDTDQQRKTILNLVKSIR
jgi:hypothetical protein